MTQSQGEVAALTQEEQNLLQELGKEKELNTQLTAKNVNLKAYLKASKERITRSFRDISKAQNELEDVSAKFSVLKAENKALIDSRKRIYLENEQFKLELSSVVELKKLIRELKFGKSRTPDLGTEGNQGFLIKDGRSTLEKIKIEVIPAPYKSPRDSTGPAKTKE